MPLAVKTKLMAWSEEKGVRKANGSVGEAEMSGKFLQNLIHPVVAVDGLAR
jgi:hypothetical protein